MFEDNISLFAMEPIATVRSCFREKFGIPRQPGLVDNLAVIEILPEYARAEAFRGLEQFSHLWLIFVFHAALRDKWNPTVRPPRLGGNERIGVFASRSMFRPNPVGLSVVQLEKISYDNNRVQLHVRGADLLDKTPILDIKPYIPYVDAVSDVKAGYAEQPPEKKYQVSFAESAVQILEQEQSRYPQLQELIRQVLQLDPRPAYSDDDARAYAVRLYEFDVHWHFVNDAIEVTTIEWLDDD